MHSMQGALSVIELTGDVLKLTRSRQGNESAHRQGLPLSVGGTALDRLSTS